RHTRSKRDWSSDVCSSDLILKGTNGRKSYQSSSTNVELSGTGQVEEETTDGSDVYLTLDSRLQTYLETLMTEVYEKHEPTSMTEIGRASCRERGKKQRDCR